MKHTVSLAKNTDFRRIYQTRRSYGSRHLVVYCVKNGMEGNRLGVSVSKKVGNSVIRHRLKRQITAIYRLAEPQIVTGRDIVVIAREGAKGCPYAELEEEFLRLLHRHQAIGNGDQEG